MGVRVVSYFFVFKQKTAYWMRISDWSSDVCSSDLLGFGGLPVIDLHFQVMHHRVPLRLQLLDAGLEGGDGPFVLKPELSHHFPSLGLLASWARMASHNEQMHGRFSYVRV